MVGANDWVVCPLDHCDPERPYGTHGPTMREALGTSLDVFAATEAIDHIGFE